MKITNVSEETLAAIKIGKILSDLAMKTNKPVKSISLNEQCSYFKDSADADYYVNIIIDEG